MRPFGAVNVIGLRLTNVWVRYVNSNKKFSWHAIVINICRTIHACDIGIIYVTPITGVINDNVAIKIRRSIRPMSQMLVDPKSTSHITDRCWLER